MAIIVHTGPMFSGKTKALVQAYKDYAEEAVAFKPVSDTRHASDVIVSHDGDSIPAQACVTAGDIYHLVPRGHLHKRVVLIDEAQFFGPALVGVVRQLENAGHLCICSCLDMDSNRLPFGAVGDLCAIASFIHKHYGECACGALARYTYRKADCSTDRFFVGGSSEYEGVCGECWLRKSGQYTLVPTCSEPKCDRPVHFRGLCATHYRLDNLSRSKRPLCSVEGCERPSSAKGLCPLHYSRQRAGRDLLAPVGGLSALREKKVCSVEGCGGDVDARGFCKKHYRAAYRRVKKGGSW